MNAAPKAAAPMSVASVGAVVRSYRKASGISQKDLAGMVGISRATLNYLESGRDIEIGAGKLLSLLEVLAVPFSIPGAVDCSADEASIDAALKGLKGRRKLPRKVVVEALTTGRFPIGLEKEVTLLIDTAPDSLILILIRGTAASSGLSPQAVWKNAGNLAKSAGSSRKAWLRGD
jgi:transcriptional regulator with XRE-family HTH domain